MINKVFLNNDNNNNNNNNIIINSHNNNTSLETNATTSSDLAILSPSIRKQIVITTLSTRGKCLMLYILLMMILIGIIIAGCIWIVKLNRKCKYLSNEQKMNNTIKNSTYPRDLLLSINDTLYRLENSLNNEQSKNLSKITVNYNELFEKLKNIITDLDDDMSKN